MQEGGSPVVGRAAVDDGFHRPTLHDSGNRDPGVVENGGGEVDIEHHLGGPLALQRGGQARVEHPLAGSSRPWNGGDQRLVGSFP